ncbi:hypothetical protein BHE74_00051368, partial [Ensete ventricosum]
MGDAMRSSAAAVTTRCDDVGSSLSIARALWKLAKRGTERGVVHSKPKRWWRRRDSSFQLQNRGAMVPLPPLS